MIKGIALELLLLIIVGFSVNCVSSTYKIKPLKVAENLLWANGIADVSVYRCPLITYTPQGNLLVVTEGRKTSGDASSKFIAARRSTDGGYNWGTTSFIYNDGFVADGDNLGVILVDDIKETIFLFFGLCNHHFKCEISSVMYVKSADDGVTWSKAVNVSKQIGPLDFAPGPGRGVQKRFAPHKGRLIICGHGGMVGTPGASCLLSDDHGDTWRIGATLPSMPYNSPLVTGDFDPNECQPEEMPDGSIMMNIRNQHHYHCRCRIIAMSYDGLETLPATNITFDTTLISPGVSASILMHKGVLYFSNPANASSRTGMTIRWSYDNGLSWAGSLKIWDGASGYSVLTAMPDHIADAKKQKYLYLVYERGQKSPTETVSLAKISLTGTL